MSSILSFVRKSFQVFIPSKGFNLLLDKYNSHVYLYEGTAQFFHSKLTRIDIPKDINPYELFECWLDEVKQATNYVYAHTMNLATVSECGNVSSRNIVLKELDGESFYFFTSNISPKYKDIIKHPQVALTFMWFYLNRENINISRQVRIEGKATEADKTYTCKVFNTTRMDTKFRSVLCNQSAEVDWNELQRRHDDLLEQISKNNLVLEMPETITGFCIIPHRIEFYHTINDRETVPDRILFTKMRDKWTCRHLEA